MGAIPNSFSISAGEGGSGGALGVAVGDRVLMLEHSIYSVISPEGCAAILWRDKGMANEAADSLKLTAEYARELSLIDEILPEPLGGAHRNPVEMATTLKEALVRNLALLNHVPSPQLQNERYSRLRAMGKYVEKGVA